MGQPPRGFLFLAAFIVTLTRTTAFVRPFGRLVRPTHFSLNYEHDASAETTLVSVPTGAATNVVQETESARLSSVFSPWPTARVTAHGDYVQDLYLEELIGGPLYAFQQSSKELPHLPLCNIDETMTRLVPTVLPLAKNDQERVDFLQAVKCFADQAQFLQQRLQERQIHAMKMHTSWLQSLWQPLVYLQYRDPLVPYVSYFLLVPEDDKLKATSDAGICRAAAVLYAMAESRRVVASAQMAPDMVGKDSSLCSAGLKYLWHATRVPQPKQDAYHLYDPARYRHAIVATHGQFFVVDIVNKDENPLPLPVLEARLRRCQELALQQQDYPQMGWATSLDRDAWTVLRQEWMENEKLATSLEQLESGAFVLALDEEVRTRPL